MKNNRDLPPWGSFGSGNAGASQVFTGGHRARGMGCGGEERRRT